MSLHSGARLGPYELLSPLGAGGMGEVWRARELALERDVALKVLPEEFVEDKERVERFRREAKLLAALNHPNIATIHAFEEMSGRHVLVMEFIDGTTMRDRLDAGPIPQKDAVDWALQIAKGLSAAHDKGIVHRDLKPENLFVTKDGRIKILDFGLAKKTERVRTEDKTSAPTVSKYTEPGTVMGTVNYMSPEQVKGHVVDERSDIFSFGAILYELLSGRRAFQRDSAAETMAAILRDEPPEMTPAAGNISSAMAHIVKHCLEKEPDRRFDSAGDIVFALSEASGAASIGASPVAESAHPRKLLVPVVVAGAAVFLGLVVARFVRRSPPAPVDAAKAIPSIAVLPFSNLSGDKEQEYFSDGLSEELMNLLSKVRELRVVGRTSSFAFKGKSEDLASIGEKLHVGTVLEGSVRRSGDRLRVSARLTSVADGFQLWAETYDRKMTDVFAVQDEIAEAVVSALKLKMLPQGRPTISRGRTSNLEAFNQYLLGWHLLNLHGKENLRRSIEAFQKAIALDPNYAAAYTLLAASEYQLYSYFPKSAAEVADGRQRALAAAERAISLDPELAAGYAARGAFRRHGWDWTGALADLERALSLDPGDPVSHLRYGNLLACLGRLPEAITEAKKAIDLDPLFSRAWGFLGMSLIASDQLSEAKEALNRAVEISPEDPQPRFFLAYISLLEGSPQAALQGFARIDDLAGRAMAEHDLGHAKESQQALDELIARRASSFAFAGEIAGVYAWRGDKDKAFEWLDRAAAQHEEDPGTVQFDPRFSKLRDDPRYAALLKKVGLPVGK